MLDQITKLLMEVRMRTPNPLVNRSAALHDAPERAHLAASSRHKSSDPRASCTNIHWLAPSLSV